MQKHKGADHLRGNLPAPFFAHVTIRFSHDTAHNSNNRRDATQIILRLKSNILDHVKFNLFALGLLFVTQCIMWRLYFVSINF